MNYTRQTSLSLQIPKQVIVVGCGGVGSWCAKFLSLAGVETLWLFDPDTVSDHNLNRLPLTPDSVGKYKSEALAEELQRFRPHGKFIPLRTFSPQTAELVGCKEASWLVCSTDTHASRLMAFEWTTEQGISYIEAAAEGDMGSATGIPAEWATAEETAPGYQSVPVWVGPSVSSAYLAVSHILHDIPMGDRAIRMGVEKPGLVRRFTIFDSERSSS